MHIDSGLVLAGVIVGFVIGLTGMGGGALMTPVLVIFFGINPAAAVSSVSAPSAGPYQARSTTAYTPRTAAASGVDPARSPFRSSSIHASAPCRSCSASARRASANSLALTEHRGNPGRTRGLAASEIGRAHV